MIAVAHSLSTDMSFPVLSSMIFIPLIGAAVIALLPKPQEWIAKSIGLVSSAAVLGLAIWLMVDFDKSSDAYQAVEKYIWIKDLGINFSLGVDGISLFFWSF